MLSEHWLHADELGSIIAQTLDGGTVTAFAYDAYGRPANDDWTGSRFRYTGQATLPEVKKKLDISERRACAALGHYRSTQRREPKGHDDEAALVADIVELGRTYGRYGYRRINALLRAAGWLVNVKRVARI